MNKYDVPQHLLLLYVR